MDSKKSGGKEGEVGERRETGEGSTCLGWHAEDQLRETAACP